MATPTHVAEKGPRGENHFGIRPKKVKAVFKMTADFKFGITEHLHKEFYNAMVVKKVIWRRFNPNPVSHDFTSWCAFITHLSPGRFMMAHMLEIKFLLQIGRGCHQ